jgi:hypothetical protein
MPRSMVQQPHLLIKSMRLARKYELSLSLDCIAVLVRVQTRDADAFGSTEHCCAQHKPLSCIRKQHVQHAPCAKINIDVCYEMTHLL